MELEVVECEIKLSMYLFVDRLIVPRMGEATGGTMQPCR